MIKVTILYPNKPCSHFDVEYYRNVHMPLAIRLLGSAVKAVSVEIGKSGAIPDQAPPFSVICAFTCESVERFTEALMPVANDLQGDIRNYTDIEPVIQFSEMCDIPLGRLEAASN